jgi:hypothetical protein
MEDISDGDRYASALYVGVRDGAVDRTVGFDLEPGLLGALERAMEIVNADMRSSGLPGVGRLVIPEWTTNAVVESWTGVSGSGGGIFPASGSDPVSALVAVADDAQDAVMETLWEVWPVCPAHQIGAHAQPDDGHAVWWCSGGGGHAFAPIGQLGSQSTRRKRAKKRDRSG